MTVTPILASLPSPPSPVMFEVGPFALRYYGLFIAIGFVVARPVRVRGALAAVFNALKGSGTKKGKTRRFTYPDQAPNAYKADGVVRFVDHEVIEVLIELFEQ